MFGRKKSGNTDSPDLVTLAATNLLTQTKSFLLFSSDPSICSFESIYSGAKLNR
jgi:hypothetical protein